MGPGSFAGYAFGARHTILLIVLLSLVAGFNAIESTPRSEDTPLSERFAIIIATWPGATPQRIESSVVEPLEQEILGIREIEEIESNIQEGVAVLRVQLQEHIRGAAVDPIWSQVTDRVDRAKRLIPAGAAVDAPQKVGPVAHTYVIALTADDPRFDLHWLTRTAQMFERRFASLTGTQEVNLLGAIRDEIVVEPDFDALHSAGIPPSQLVGALRSANTKQGIGSLRLDDYLLVTEVPDSLTSIRDIEETPLQTRAGMQRIGDFASVRLGAVEPSPSATVNGERAVFIGVRAQQFQRVDLWSDSAAVLLEELAADLPDGVTATLVFDQSHYINGRIANLLKNFATALVLVVLITAFLMGARVAWSSPARYP